MQQEQQAAWQQLMEQQLEQLQQQVGRDPLPGQLAGMEQALRQLQAQADSTPTHSTLGSLRTHGKNLLWCGKTVWRPSSYQAAYLLKAYVLLWTA